MEPAPLRPVPGRPDAPVSDAAAVTLVAAAMPALPERERTALALVALAGTARARGRHAARHRRGGARRIPRPRAQGAAPHGGGAAGQRLVRASRAPDLGPHRRRAGRARRAAPRTSTCATARAASSTSAGWCRPPTRSSRASTPLPSPPALVKPEPSALAPVEAGAAAATAEPVPQRARGGRLERADRRRVRARARRARARPGRRARRPALEQPAHRRRHGGQPGRVVGAGRPRRPRPAAASARTRRAPPPRRPPAAPGRRSRRPRRRSRARACRPAAPAASRVAARAGRPRSGPTALPSSQQTTVTPASWVMTVPSRSGSATTPSAPAASISARAAPRVVPRTAWPSARSASASARPRQPQPTIRTRATR